MEPSLPLLVEATVVLVCSLEIRDQRVATFIGGEGGLRALIRDRVVVFEHAMEQTLADRGRRWPVGWLRKVRKVSPVVVQRICRRRYHSSRDI